MQPDATIERATNLENEAEQIRKRLFQASKCEMRGGDSFTEMDMDQMVAYDHMVTIEAGRTGIGKFQGSYKYGSMQSQDMSDMLDTVISFPLIIG
jgi:hypothetical protein